MFISFPGNYGYSLISYQNSRNVPLLKIGCNVKSELILVNFVLHFIKILTPVASDNIMCWSF